MSVHEVRNMISIDIVRSAVNIPGEPLDAGPSLRADESRRIFGINDFAVEVIRASIFRKGSTIMVGSWLEEMVPDVYRNDAIKAVHTVARTFLAENEGRAMSDDVLDDFSFALSSRIRADVEPKSLPKDRADP